MGLSFTWFGTQKKVFWLKNTSVINGLNNDMKDWGFLCLPACLASLQASYIPCRISW